MAAAAFFRGTALRAPTARDASYAARAATVDAHAGCSHTAASCVYSPRRRRRLPREGGAAHGAARRRAPRGFARPPVLFQTRACRATPASARPRRRRLPRGGAAFREAAREETASAPTHDTRLRAAARKRRQRGKSLAARRHGAPHIDPRPSPDSRPTCAARRTTRWNSADSPFRRDLHKFSLSIKRPRL